MGSAETGLEPVSSALAGRFFSTEPPRKLMDVSDIKVITKVFSLCGRIYTSCPHSLEIHPESREGINKTDPILTFINSAGSQTEGWVQIPLY